MNTKNVSATAPACMKAFSEAKPGIIGELSRQGLHYCLYFRLVGEHSPTIGDWEFEWRLHGLWIFSAERFEFSELEERLQQAKTTPVLIGQKAYTHVVGLGVHAQFGRLNAGEFAELLSVFDRAPQYWSKTDEEEFELLKLSVNVRLLREGR